MNQRRTAVAVVLALSDNGSGLGFEQLDAATELLRETQCSAQRLARCGLDAIEGGVEMHERLLHVREHVFNITNRCHI